MRQWTGSALLQIMACRLFGTKPLPDPMMAYSQLDSWEQISVKFESEFYHFHSIKCIWKCCLPNWRPFCPGGDELMFQQHQVNNEQNNMDIYTSACKDMTFMSTSLFQASFLKLWKTISSHLLDWWTNLCENSTQHTIYKWSCWIKKMSFDIVYPIKYTYVLMLCF